MKYRYLLFDADQTLLDFTKAQRSALSVVLEKYGFPKEESVFEDFRVFNDEMWKRFERKEISKSELIRTRFVLFCQKYGIEHPSDGTLEKTYQEALSNAAFLMPDALEVCGRLSRHFRMYIVTNGLATTQYQRLELSGLRPLFQDVFVSESLHAQKPSIEYFEAVYEALGKPDKKDMIIIGDSLRSDIKGGEMFGIDTCHVKIHSVKEDESLASPTYTITSLKELYTILYEQP
ncbi:MAG: noncanonical pyrimidine nucleotidase, YjjG family [Lachnospiraceae bacterium]|nr:noncanonical pyrimidine nucleotidase, YjjG family [Lachnospiraceae bacterium]